MPNSMQQIPTFAEKPPWTRGNHRTGSLMPFEGRCREEERGGNSVVSPPVLRAVFEAGHTATVARSQGAGYNFSES